MAQLVLVTGVECAAAVGVDDHRGEGRVVAAHHGMMSHPVMVAPTRIGRARRRERQNQSKAADCRQNSSTTHNTTHPRHSARTLVAGR